MMFNDAQWKWHKIKLYIQLLAPLELSRAFDAEFPVVSSCLNHYICYKHKLGRICQTLHCKGKFYNTKLCICAMVKTYRADSWSLWWQSSGLCEIARPNFPWITTSFPVEPAIWGYSPFSDTANKYTNMYICSSNSWLSHIYIYNYVYIIYIIIYIYIQIHPMNSQSAKMFSYHPMDQPRSAVYGWDQSPPLPSAPPPTRRPLPTLRRRWRSTWDSSGRHTRNGQVVGRERVVCWVCLEKIRGKVFSPLLNHNRSGDLTVMKWEYQWVFHKILVVPVIWFSWNEYNRYIFRQTQDVQQCQTQVERDWLRERQVNCSIWDALAVFTAARLTQNTYIYGPKYHLQMSI